MTNLLPKQRECFTYHQKRNDILIDFAKLLINRTPVRRACEILEIGSNTYYGKLEWLYQKCLEFLERHETQALRKTNFKELWLKTDQFVYNLNNVRRKGSGGVYDVPKENSRFETYAVVTGELWSQYVFRSDIAYDWAITLNDIEKDTEMFKSNYMPESNRRYGRLRISYAPKLPSNPSPEDIKEYEDELKRFDVRRDYVDGLHVKSSYTIIAHYWLLKNTLNVKEWRVITDAESTLLTAFNRVFMNEVRSGYAHHFLCYTDREKRIKEAIAEYKAELNKLYQYASSKGLDRRSIYKIGLEKLKEDLEIRPLYKLVSVGNDKFPIPLKAPLPHPVPTRDQGLYYIDCTTDLSGYHPNDLAELLIKVNNKVTNAFMQQIRRRLSVLERPLVMARHAEGKSYIYANYNPKYAQYALTILRTYYNFCKATKSFRHDERLTPAQRLGIASRQYTWKDIIYFS